MRPLYQKPFNYAPSFNSHLHCSSPLHSTIHNNNPKMTGVRLTSKALQPMNEFRCSLVFLCHPLLDSLCTITLLRYAWHTYNEAFDFDVHVTVHRVKFLIIKPTRCTNFSNFFWKETLHVSDSSSVQHQEFFTVHTTMVYVINVC
jgi:hypothetical protein